MNTSEEWRQIGRFPDYEVSSTGRVRSRRREYSRPHSRNPAYTLSYSLPGKILRPAAPDGNRVLVNLRLNRKTVRVAVHRLVLEAFVGPCPAGMEGCHNDGNALNNCVANLRWDTHKENMADSARHGTRVLAPIYYGESHSEAKLSAVAVAEIRATPIRHGSKAALARKFGVSRKTILNVLQGKAWRYESGIVERRSQER